MHSVSKEYARSPNAQSSFPPFVHGHFGSLFAGHVPHSQLRPSLAPHFFQSSFELGFDQPKTRVHKTMSNLASASGCSKPRSKPVKSTVLGKSVHQVQRRNERERRRVQQINNGYTVLAKSVAGWKECKNRQKLSKVETLRAAVKYIKHLEEVLNASGANMTSANKPSPNFDYSLYIQPKMEQMSPPMDQAGYNIPNSCYPQLYDQRLSMFGTSACSSGSGYDSAYASPTYGQPRSSYSQMFMNISPQFYGMQGHENMQQGSR